MFINLTVWLKLSQETFSQITISTFQILMSEERREKQLLKRFIFWAPDLTQIHLITISTWKKSATKFLLKVRNLSMSLANFSTSFHITRARQSSPRISLMWWLWNMIWVKWMGLRTLTFWHTSVQSTRNTSSRYLTNLFRNSPLHFKAYLKSIHHLLLEMLRWNHLQALHQSLRKNARESRFNILFSRKKDSSQR